MRCENCQVVCKYNLMLLCEMCDTQRKNSLEVHRPIYESQYECCKSCGSFYFLRDCVYLQDTIICNRCYKAIYMFRQSVARMSNAIPYLQKHGSRISYRTQKRSCRNMVLNRKLYDQGFRKCSDCRAWCVNKGSYCDKCSAQHTSDLKPYRKNRQEILTQYNYTCEICNTRKPSSKLALDHDHESGAFRGVLCRNCNGAIGLMRDDITLVSDLRRYLLYLCGGECLVIPVQPLVYDGKDIHVSDTEVEIIKAQYNL